MHNFSLYAKNLQHPLIPKSLMLKSLLIPLFFCPSVWSAAEVIFDTTEVEVPGTSLRLPNGFLDFHGAVKEEAREYARANDYTKEPRPKAINWFFNQSYREAFIIAALELNSRLEDELKQLVPPTPQEAQELLNNMTHVIGSIMTNAPASSTPAMTREELSQSYAHAFYEWIKEIASIFNDNDMIKNWGKKRGYTYPLDFSISHCYEDISYYLTLICCSAVTSLDKIQSTMGATT